MKDSIGINFLRPYSMSAYAFTRMYKEALEQVKKLGISWIRLLFPQRILLTGLGEYQFGVYDDIVELCGQMDIGILAVLRGRGDAAGVVSFYQRIQSHFQGALTYYELDCPSDADISRYLEDYLIPGSRALKAAQPDCMILPDQDSRLPQGFYQAARGYFDVAHDACIPDWGFLRLDTGCDAEVEKIRQLRDRLDAAGCEDVPLWITEAGWFGTAGLTGEVGDYYNILPEIQGEEEIAHEPVSPQYTGAALLNHELTRHEDALCAQWLKECYPRLLEEGVERIFHTRLLDEFEGGYRPDAVYGHSQHPRASLWGVIGGNGKPRASAKALSEVAGKVQGMPAPAHTYLRSLHQELARTWPENRTVNIVCHGHSVPAGYFATPAVDTFHAYPHLLHRGIKERYPHAVVNVIVTAIGGEASPQGLARFQRDVLCHRPDLITLDYALNDRRVGLAAAEKAWRGMIETALCHGIPVILLTPSWDDTVPTGSPDGEDLKAHARQIRRLAAEYQVGLADSFAAFKTRVRNGEPLENLLSQSNHPNAQGHTLIAGELLKFF